MEYCTTSPRKKQRGERDISVGLEENNWRAQEDTIVRALLPKLPPIVRAAKQKNGPYQEVKANHALLQHRFMNFNQKALVSFIIVDIDDHQDVMCWQDYNLPEPTWVVKTDRGLHIAWMLKKPIPMLQNGQGKLGSRFKTWATRIKYRLADILGADEHAVGFNRIFRNPVQNDTIWFGNTVMLSHFHMLHEYEEPEEQRARHIRNQKSYPRWKMEEMAARSFYFMKKGDGRNDALFARCALRSYLKADDCSYSYLDLLEFARKQNRQFMQSLKDAEVIKIVDSVHKFITIRYKKGGEAISLLSEQERIERARSGGIASGAIRHENARLRVINAAHELDQKGEKITTNKIKKMVGGRKELIKQILEEQLWVYFDKKTGWKHISKRIVIPEEEFAWLFEPEAMAS